MKIAGDERKGRRKALRLLCFLLSGLLVMTASAAVYYSLSMQPSVKITAAVVSFKEGNDWKTGTWSMGTNNTWCALALKAYPNATLTYEQPLNLTNTGTSVNLTLRTVSISPASGIPDVGNFVFINFTLHDETGAVVGSLNYTVDGSNNWSTPAMSFVPMDANDKWYITIQTKASATAQADVVASIEIAVDVRE